MLVSSNHNVDDLRSSVCCACNESLFTDPNFTWENVECESPLHKGNTSLHYNCGESLLDPISGHQHYRCCPSCKQTFVFINHVIRNLPDGDVNLKILDANENLIFSIGIDNLKLYEDYLFNIGDKGLNFKTSENYDVSPVCFSLTWQQLSTMKEVVTDFEPRTVQLKMDYGYLRIEPKVTWPKRKESND